MEIKIGILLGEEKRIFKGVIEDLCLGIYNTGDSPGRRHFHPPVAYLGFLNLPGHLVGPVTLESLKFLPPPPRKYEVFP